MFIDIFLCVLSVWIAFGLRLDQWHLFQGSQWLAVITSVGFLIPLFFAFGLYKTIFRYVSTNELISITPIFFLYSCLFFIIFSILEIENVPRSIGVIQPLVLFICIGASRYFIRIWLGSIGYVKVLSGHEKRIVLIYGAGSTGRKLSTGLFADRGILIKGFIDDDVDLQGNTINSLPIYGSKDIKTLLIRLGITDVLLAIPSANQGRRNEIIDALSGCGVRVRSVPRLFDIASGRIKISDFNDLDMNDLLGRKAVSPNEALLEKNIRHKTILVTGAGGSIGGELCRQIIKFSPRAMILVDISEHALYSINEELKNLMIRQGYQELSVDDDAQLTPIKEFPIKLSSHLASVRDKELMLNIFNAHRPDSVYHAAAYKHVPLVELNPAEGIRNNVFGTLACAQASLETGVSHFTLISTDKAVRPTNVMGASKRIAELVLQALADDATKEEKATKFSMVRFGNVLGSSGSVAPLFRAQIQSGGPITLTHPEVTRYFMTIPEAAQLVIQSSAMTSGGDVFVLDMGEPVRIFDLAVKMIYMSGFLVKDESNPQGDIEIKITGLRPGEKLYEELLIGNDPKPTIHPKIMKANENFLSWPELEMHLSELNQVLDQGDIRGIHFILQRLVCGYNPNQKLGSESA